jgi:sigma-B regulation protein RsbU (phosphoserine phosphatase)
MLSTTEKVAILKSVSLFAEASDEILAEVTSLAEEVAVNAGETIIQRGDVGTSMYIIASGRVRVHDGERTLNYLRQHDMFGEMALLDSEARVASVTAIEDTRLLRLDQEPIYELMRERIEVTRGIIKVLSRHLRDRVEDLDQVRDHLEQVIIPLGIALSTEKSLDRLLERILIEAKSICNADAGTIYLVTQDDCLSFSIVRTDSLNIAMGGTTGKEVPFPPLCLYDDTGEPNDHNVATHVALHSHSINIPNIYQADEFDFSGTKAFDEENSYRSISSFTVPLKDHVGEVIGVLQLFNAQDPETGEVIPFDPYYQLVVESLASQAAVALNTQMLLRRQKELLKFEHDLQVGRRIQANFLPSELPQPPGWEIAAQFHPAREVAGDFYDAFLLPGERIGLIIADVVDKGVGAALFMALSRSLLRAYAEQHYLTHTAPRADAQANAAPGDGQRPAPSSSADSVLDVVKLTNDYIAKNHADLTMFATLFFGVLEPRTGFLTYVNGGHDPPAIVSSSGEVKARLLPTGPAVGMMLDMDFQIERVSLEPGDILMTFTDGVADARDPNGKLFSKEGLLSLLEEPADSAAALLGRIEASLRSHIADADQFDDITMLAVRRVPVSEG